MTRSYGEVAAAAGSPGAARAVGQVMAANRTPLIVPCHRVLAAGGKIGGFSAPQGLALKRRLLALESGEGAGSSQGPARARRRARSAGLFVCIGRELDTRSRRNSSRMTLLRASAESLGAVAVLVAIAATPRPCAAITIEIDYSYDTNGFFGAGNPNGQGSDGAGRARSRRGVLLDNSHRHIFRQIVEPPDFRSSVGTGYAFWDWSLAFDHPATGDTVMLEHQTIGRKRVSHVCRGT